MNRRRQRKIHNLKHRHVLPRLIVMVILFGTVFVIDFFVMYFIIQNIIGNRIITGYEHAMTVAKLFEENCDNEYFLNRDIYEFKNLVTDITDVCIVDADNNVVRMFGNEVPDFSLEKNIEFSGESITIIPDDVDNDIFSDDSAIGINMNKFVHPYVDLKMINPLTTITFESAKADWVNVRCWYVKPFDNGQNKACVYGTIRIRYYELYCVLFAFLFTLIVTIIFCLYQFIELVIFFFDQKRVFKILHTDFVTGGNNRAMFMDYGTRLLKSRRKYVVAFLRLEKYRGYCLYYGEKQGDELLEKIYWMINSFIGKKELVSRVEGPDFAMLLRYDDEREIGSRIEEILARLDTACPEEKLYFSVGVSRANKANNPISLYNEAGIARRAIKEDDEVRIAWFNDSMRADQIWERKVEKDMGAALENGEFKVYLQPKYSTGNETLKGAEALVRWIHPTEGFVPPGRFIPIFEKNGFVLKLDDFMIGEVAKLQSEWLKAGKNIVPISVNVSRAHFTREDLAEHISSIVDAYNVPHEYIELELTESAFFDGKEILLKTVNKMKELGFHVSMDDFGAGYSSLNSLKELPLDVVKLDAEFFRGTDDFERANLIVSQTIALAKQLGMTIVAEGIETREQVDFLADQKCDLIQGYYFAKPMPVDDFEERAFS